MSAVCSTSYSAQQPLQGFRPRSLPHSHCSHQLRNATCCLHSTGQSPQRLLQQHWQHLQQQQQQQRQCQHKQWAFSSDKQPVTALDSLEDLEMAVPEDQRPVNELASLKEAFLYNWATLPLSAYLTKVALVFGVTFTLIGAPIANQTFPFAKEPLEFALSATTGSLLVVAVLMLRIYLGWGYVQERLRSAAVPYEETGWYDGQTFVKPPEVLTRDRLLASYQVKPVLEKLRRTLLGAGVLLLTSSVLLVGLIQTGTEDGVYVRGGGSGKPVPRQVTADGVLYGKRVKDLSQLANDDELAAEEAAAQGGVPGYCADRFLRAYAGGQYCSKFEK